MEFWDLKCDLDDIPNQRNDSNLKFFLSNSEAKELFFQKIVYSIGCNYTFDIHVMPKLDSSPLHQALKRD